MRRPRTVSVRVRLVCNCFDLVLLNSFDLRESFVVILTVAGLIRNLQEATLQTRLVEDAIHNVEVVVVHLHFLGVLHDHVPLHGPQAPYDEVTVQAHTNQDLMYTQMNLKLFH
jgi:hypothetical protein